MNSTWKRFSWALIFVVCTTVQAQNGRIDPAGIEGALLMAGSYKVTPEMAEKFVDLAGGAKAKIVIVTFDKAKFGGTPVELLAQAAKKREAAEPMVVDYAD